MDQIIARGIKYSVLTYTLPSGFHVARLVRVSEFTSGRTIKPDSVRIAGIELNVRLARRRL